MQRPPRHYLFHTTSIRTPFEKMSKYARAQIEAMEDDAILACDVEATALEVLNRFKFEKPVLDELGINVKQPTPVREPPMPTYYLIEYFVPFRGEAEVFKWQPITPPCSPPLAEVEGSEIHFQYFESHTDAEKVRRQFDHDLLVVRQYLKALEVESDAQFAKLLVEIRAVLSQRRKELALAGVLARDLGYPLRRRDDANTIAVPIARKQIAISPANGAARPVTQEPHLEETVYAEILDVLASMSLLLERNPTTFGHLGEETLRDLFLLQLNGQFQGKATGETFNAGGKTDILLRDGNTDKNVFIAECKFWDGPESMIKAINQLFDYLAWRDTKAALLVFSSRKDFTRTVSDARETLKRHPQFRRELPSTRDTSFRAKMARPDDEERLIDLTTMMFNVPHV